MRITDLDRSHGFWSATIHTEAASVDVDCRHGSWQTVTSGHAPRRDVLPRVAAELQAAVRKLERKRGGDAASALA